jgi:predicted pyridoxine 5'-phosphate oxidase superfamily flavin-nucleotide-binding protein
MTHRHATGPAIDHRPGSRGEHALQEQYGTTERAHSFYQRQVLPYLNARMRQFISRQEMCFVATADADGECDCTFRAGTPGFVHVLDDRTLAYPEYRGNGVMASLGNLLENPQIGLLFIDFTQDVIGLHVNGTARIVEGDELLRTHPALASTVLERVATGNGGRLKAERWVRVHVQEAYIHCAKHIPRMVKLPREIAWGTDDVRRKGGDFFGASCEPRSWDDQPGTS